MDESVELPWGMRLQIAKDIAKGMVYLHSRNVFHRDLNPKVRQIMHLMHAHKQTNKQTNT